MRVFSFFLVLCLASVGRADDKWAFPYLYTAPELTDWESFRVETISVEEAKSSALTYIKKWFYKVPLTSPEQKTYFDFQRGVMRTLKKIEPPGTSVGVAMVGDLMWIQNAWDTFLDDKVLAEMNRHEVVLGNLESPLSPFHPVPSTTEALVYNSDPRLVTSFRRTNGTNTFTALSFANNHTMDTGEDGALATLAILDREKILHSGATRGHAAKAYVTFVRGGIKFGFLAMAQGSNDPALENPKDFRYEIIPGLKAFDGSKVDFARVKSQLDQMTEEGVQFKIVSLHWGSEFELNPDPQVMQSARRIVELGADVILGAHPHVQVPQEVLFVNGYEKRLGLEKEALAHNAVLTGAGGPRKALVVYSMGNFVSKMWSFLSEIGMLQTLRVVSDGTTADWYAPKAQYVYNSRDRSRKLMFLSDYFRSNRRGFLSRAKEKRLFGLLDKHLWTKSLDAREEREIQNLGYEELLKIGPKAVLHALFPGSEK